MSTQQNHPETGTAACMDSISVNRMLKGLEESFAAKDIERIASGWTEDIVIRFAGFPEILGKEEGRKWLAFRFSRQKDYRIRKTIRAITGHVIGDSWTGEWIDAGTGKKMQGFGMEFLTMRDGKIAVWEAAFNGWEAGVEKPAPWKT